MGVREEGANEETKKNYGATLDVSAFSSSANDPADDLNVAAIRFQNVKAGV